jgi:hypothetical protein
MMAEEVISSPIHADAGPDQTVDTNVQVTLNKEGDPNKVTAIIQLPGVERVAADQIAQRIDGMEYEGRYLKAFVPLFM